MKVFSNLAVSADGKIADLVDPRQRLGTRYDHALMDVIRRRADAVLVGATTLEIWPVPLKIKQKNARQKQPINVVLTRSGRLPREAKFWTDSRIVRFVFTTEKGFKKALELSQDRAFVFAVGKTEIDLDQVLKRLAQSGVKNLLVEGGGEIMALFLRARLLHELYLTWTPWLVGGRQNPGLVGGDAGLLPWTKLKILKMKRREQEVYFHLSVPGARRV